MLQGRAPDNLICIYVGRLANEKRVELLLQVARTPGIALTIIGDGARREELETIFAGTGTHFTGYLLDEELACAFASADLFAFTGPNETFGQVVQEAMASGLPAIVIDQGAVKDLVLEGETGFICPGEPQAFADAAMRLRGGQRVASADVALCARAGRAAPLGKCNGRAGSPLPRGRCGEQPPAAHVSTERRHPLCPLPFFFGR